MLLVHELAVFNGAEMALVALWEAAGTFELYFRANVPVQRQL